MDHDNQKVPDEKESSSKWTIVAFVVASLLPETPANFIGCVVFGYFGWQWFGVTCGVVGLVVGYFVGGAVIVFVHIYMWDQLDRVGKARSKKPPHDDS